MLTAAAVLGGIVLIAALRQANVILHLNDLIAHSYPPAPRWHQAPISRSLVALTGADAQIVYANREQTYFATLGLVLLVPTASATFGGTELFSEILVGDNKGTRVLVGGVCFGLVVFSLDRFLIQPRALGRGGKVALYGSRVLVVVGLSALVGLFTALNVFGSAIDEDLMQQASDDAKAALEAPAPGVPVGGVTLSGGGVAVSVEQVHARRSALLERETTLQKAVDDKVGQLNDQRATVAATVPSQATRVCTRRSRSGTCVSFRVVSQEEKRQDLIKKSLEAAPDSKTLQAALDRDQAELKDVGKDLAALPKVTDELGALQRTRDRPNETDIAGAGLEERIDALLHGDEVSPEQWLIFFFFILILDSAVVLMKLAGGERRHDRLFLDPHQQARDVEEALRPDGPGAALLKRGPLDPRLVDGLRKIEAQSAQARAEAADRKAAAAELEAKARRRMAAAADDTASAAAEPGAGDAGEKGGGQLDVVHLTIEGEPVVWRPREAPLIASGAYAEVFGGVTPFGRPFAVKVVKPGRDDFGGSRREQTVYIRLYTTDFRADHSPFVRMWRMPERPDGTVLIVMARYHDANLHDYLEARRTARRPLLTVGQVLTVLHRVVVALRMLHGAGYAWVDLGAQNLFIHAALELAAADIELNDEWDRVMGNSFPGAVNIGDFNMSFPFGERPFLAASGAAEAFWMEPELLAGATVVPDCDVYAFHRLILDLLWCSTSDQAANAADPFVKRMGELARACGQSRAQRLFAGVVNIDDKATWTAVADLLEQRLDEIRREFGARYHDRIPRTEGI